MGDSLGISEAWELSCTEVICGRYVFLSQVSLTRRRRGHDEACRFMGRDISQMAFLVILSVQDSFEKMNVQAVRTCHRNGLVKDAGTDHLRVFDAPWVFDGNTRNVGNKHKRA